MPIHEITPLDSGSASTPDHDMLAPHDIKEPEISQRDQSVLETTGDGILNRHPAVGFALGVVREGSLEFFYGHGYADIAAKTPVSENTVFRVGSITKTLTAIAIMQL